MKRIVYGGEKREKGERETKEKKKGGREREVNTGIRAIKGRNTKREHLVFCTKPRYHVPREGDQPWNGIGGTQIGEGINPGCLSGPKPSAPPPFVPTAYRDKSTPCLVLGWELQLTGAISQAKVQTCKPS